MSSIAKARRLLSGWHASAASSKMLIEVCYAEPERSVRQAFALPAGATVAAALRAAAADPAFAGIAIHGSAVGVFGKIVSLSQILEDGDRVEIYRPLAADPKTARRARASESRRRGSGGVSKSGRS